MSIEEIQLKQFVFIKFLKQITNDSSWNFKQEYSTNDKDTKVVTVQEQAGEKVVFYVEYNTSGTETISANIYTDSGKSKNIGTIKLKNGIINLNEIMAKYSSRLNTYKYTFKQSSDGDYYFYSIEKDK